MKEYISENSLNKNITVIIKAIDLDEAYEVLGVTVKDHNEFNHIN